MPPLNAIPTSFSFIFLTILSTTFSTFPEDFKLTGSFMDKWERIGRAVPPFMMKEIATAVSNTLKS